MSALDGFVTAAVTGPRFADPQDWMCALMGLPRDVLAKGSANRSAVFASLARIHKRINETLFDRPQDCSPHFTTKPSGGIDPGRGARGSTRPRISHQTLQTATRSQESQPRPAAADPDHCVTNNRKAA
ncbi:UPF0149 family protein [Mesorhizobium argentiipisi]|uniref:UPF0149 family protein n=1 Tax=Mesorhizobium argentiipisi TaxID=3015175 RepID=A0ABU8K7V8_9HYPH